MSLVNGKVSARRVYAIELSNPADPEQASRAHPVRAALVFLDLLK
jgi:hypothetical protein